MDDNLLMFRIMTSSAFLSRARCAAFKAFSFEFSLINLHLCYCLQILNLKQTTALLCNFTGIICFPLYTPPLPLAEDTLLKPLPLSSSLSAMPICCRACFPYMTQPCRRYWHKQPFLNHTRTSLPVQQGGPRLFFSQPRPAGVL